MDRYDVFISYARVDATRARLIREKLAALGLSVFFDAEGIDTGEEFPDIIDRAVKGARCVLGLWSRGAFQGRWVRIESRIGLDQRKLVAAFIDGMRPEELPAEFYNVNVESLADYRGQDGHDGWARIVRAIGKRIGRSDLAALAPNAAPAPTGGGFNIANAVAAMTPQQRAAGGAAALVALAGALYGVTQLNGPGALTPGAASASINLDLSGQWIGSYTEAGRAVPFDAEIYSTQTASGAALSGSVGEPNAFGIGDVTELRAAIQGEARGDGSVVFTKTYNGAGGVSHQVRYEGRIENGGRTIVGTWDTGRTHGDFRMDRR